jgi:hypothetical protein
VWTTVNLNRTVAVTLTTYADSNSNNVKDPGEGPPTQTTTIALKKADGSIIMETTAHQWTFIQTLQEGDYYIHIKSAGLLPDVMLLPISAGAQTLVVESERGLKPVNAEMFFPILLIE